MSDLRVATRYVKSLIGLAVERGVLENVHDDMRLFLKTCRENRPLPLLLRNPVIRHDDKRQILKKIFSKRVDPLTLAIFDLLTRKNREAILLAIAMEFQNAYNDYKSIGQVYLTTTIPLDGSFKSEIEKIAKKLTHKKTIEIHERQDDELIGGFIFQIGDQRLDTSLRRQLKILELKFKESYFEKDKST